MNRHLGSALLCVVLVSAPGCFASSRGSWSVLTDPDDYERYEWLCEREQQAEANPGDPAAVLAYAVALISVADSLSGDLKEGEWKARTRRGAELIAGIVPHLEPAAAAQALLRQATLLAHATQATDPSVLVAVRDAYGRVQNWETGTALLTVLGLTQPPPPEVVPLCETTYASGMAEQVPGTQVMALLDVCVGFVPEGQTAEQTFPKIPADVWARFEQRMQEEAEHRIAQREYEAAESARAKASAPCVYNFERGRYQRCEKFVDGACWTWGPDCGE